LTQVKALLTAISSGTQEVSSENQISLWHVDCVHVKSRSWEVVIRVLKISILDTPEEKKIVLEGKFTEPWISEVAKVWHREQQYLNGRNYIVDLSDVTDIDPCGMAILSGMIREGVKLIANGLLTSYLIETLQEKVRQAPLIPTSK
jgi:ABC-type transporter Mla MlaB component